MRLVSIGRSKSSTICIPNEYVSANHAELVLLDNGDILLTDCNSTHGTFYFGKRITPNVEVPVKRGDKIDFDQIPLDWSKVPTVPQPDIRVVKGIYGIGKNPRNRYRLSGDSVSRYHATFKEMKNGTWFIQDHSTNGTFVNGQRIPSNQDYKISHKDQIVCGSVGCPNPVPAPKISVQMLAGIGAVAAIIVFVWLLINGDTHIASHQMDPRKAVAQVIQTYRIKVVFDDDPIKKKFGVDDWYVKGEFEGLDNYGKPVYSYDLTQYREDALVMSHTGTAFFVSPDGLLITNRHVTDWVWADNHYNHGEITESIREQIEEWRTQAYKKYVISSLFGYDGDASMERWLTSSFRFEVETESFALRYPGRAYTAEKEYDLAQLEAQSDNDDVDIAVLRLNSRETPEYADYFRMKDAITDISKLQMGSKNYYTIGFPTSRPDMTSSKPDATVTPTYGLLHLVQAPKRNQLFMKGDESVGGQSGSPIYDEKNRLIGVLWGGWTSTVSTGACPIGNAFSFLQSIMDDDEFKNGYKEKFR